MDLFVKQVKTDPQLYIEHATPHQEIQHLQEESARLKSDARFFSHKNRKFIKVLTKYSCLFGRKQSLEVPY